MKCVPRLRRLLMCGLPTFTQPWTRMLITGQCTLTAWGTRVAWWAITWLVRAMGQVMCLRDVPCNTKTGCGLISLMRLGTFCSWCRSTRTHSCRGVMPTTVPRRKWQMISLYRLEDKWRIRYFEDVDVWVAFPPLTEIKALPAGFLTWEEAVNHVRERTSGTRA